MRYLLVIVLIAGCVSAQTTAPATQPTTAPAFEVGRIEDPAIKENSGIVESRRYPGVFWTLNDSGNPPELYAIDRSGKTIGTFPVNAKNRDWEDLAIDDAGNLYIGEIGNNGGRLKELAVYRVTEPDPRAAVPIGGLAVTQTWWLTFPEQPFDCEGLFIWQNVGYVVSKYRDYRNAGLYRFPLDVQTKPAVLEKVCELPIRFPCTAADISRKGDQVVVLSVGGPFLFDLPKPGDVASIATAKSRSVFFTSVDLEAACFVEEGILATTEKRSVHLFKWADFSK